MKSSPLSRWLCVVSIALLVLMVGAAPASANPKPKGPAIVGSGVVYPDRPFSVNASTDKHTGVASGDLYAEVVNQGTLHGIVTCISNSYLPEQVAVSGSVAADSSVDPTYVGFNFDARDLEGTYDELDIHLLDWVPGPDDCARLQGQAGSGIVSEGGFVVYPAKGN